MGAIITKASRGPKATESSTDQSKLPTWRGRKSPNQCDLWVVRINGHYGMWVCGFAQYDGALTHILTNAHSHTPGLLAKLLLGLTACASWWILTESLI